MKMPSRPDALALRLSASLDSDSRPQLADYSARLVGRWQIPSEEYALPDPACEWHQEEGELTTEVGKLTVFTFSIRGLDRDQLSALFDGDDVTTSAFNTLRRLLQRPLPSFGGRLPDVIHQVVVLDTVEVSPAFRGHGVGSWAAARVLQALAPAEDALIAATAAPISTAEFLSGPTHPGQRMNEQERASWEAMQRRLWTHWQKALGLFPLPEDDEVLVGLGSLDEARRASLRRWG